MAAEGRHFVGHILLLRQLAERPGGGGGSEAMTKKINPINTPKPFFTNSRPKDFQFIVYNLEIII
ncbi:MAG TPA: hypothetical protein PLW31_14485 [Bacteroidales bacterium]|nr:hypothetical protein [Bacteroidales bacterium]